MFQPTQTTSRFGRVIEKHKVNQFYTAPTAVRSLMVKGEDVLGDSDLSSLRLLGSVGEPINPEAWEWYRRVFGKGVCPIVDTWWQTETGGIMIVPLPGATAASLVQLLVHLVFSRHWLITRVIFLKARSTVTS